MPMTQLQAPASASSGSWRLGMKYQNVNTGLCKDMPLEISKINGNVLVFFQASAMDFQQEVSFKYNSIPEKVENKISNWI